MRLYNLFLVLLLCMTVGMFSACTGDDGEAGPQGEPGADAEITEEVIEEIAEQVDTEVTAFYAFLKSWGSQTGEIACSDPMLMGMGPLPGSDMLEEIDPRSTANDVDFLMTCKDGLFSSVDVDFNKSGGEFEAGTSEVHPGIVLKKETRGETSSAERIDVQPTSFNPPTRISRTKKFVGGSLYASFDTTGGTDEPLQRLLLHTQCDVGEGPTKVRGSWSAVQITDEGTIYHATTGLGIDGDSDESNGVTPTYTAITTKICMNLDSLPGVTKCYKKVAGHPDSTMNGEEIGLYDESGFTAVVSNKELTDDIGTAITQSTITGSDILFVGDAAANTGEQIPALDVTRACKIFDEGG